ncbi:MAG: endopeptidase La [Spirochaetales bacterium]|nr:endopeptidase La [Spirochaetales bacterium]
MLEDNVNEDKLQDLVLPISDDVIFPELHREIKVPRTIGKAMNSRFKQGSPTVAIVTQRNTKEKSKKEHFFKVGTRAEIKDISPVGELFRVRLFISDRIAIQDMDFSGAGIIANYTSAPDEIDLDEHDHHDMVEYVKEVIREMGSKFKGIEAHIKIIDDMTRIQELIAYTMPYINLSVSDKQVLLEMESVKERGLKFLDYLIQQKESISLQIRMAQKFSDSANDMYRKNVLREQLKAIQKELGEGSGKKGKKPDYHEKIEESGMPDEVKEVALEELQKFESQDASSPDSHILRNYLDLLVALPWKSGEYKDIDLESARKVLDDQHYGLEKVKERIIQHLAVMKLKKEKSGTILLLVGPPGTGKTSLGRSIAEALGRKYHRISLGGIRDEAEIRGHRRTYVGALPGRIISGMKKVGEKNPVFVLDEVDKIMVSYSGDPASALLEVLDPEQNDSFSDHYLEVPYDLSEVFFIATANSLEGIPIALLDRMEAIDVSGYTDNEKLHIAERHLLPEVLKDHGLTTEQLTINEEAITALIRDYTREAGVRNLKRQLAKVARSSTEKIVNESVTLPYAIDAEIVEEIMGNKKVRHDVAESDNPSGVVTGLAWTPVGGEVLFIESTLMDGHGKLTLTGQLGDVMKESAEISLSLIRSRLAFHGTGVDYDTKDLHVHVPSGAVPKDGPSAGIALLTSLASLVLGLKVDPKIAMTGEITLRGSVMPVGGIKEKILAAHRAGITKVLLPKENEKDLKEVPEEVREEITFVPVERVEEVIKEALGFDLPAAELLSFSAEATSSAPLAAN